MNDYAQVVAPRTIRLERTLPGPIERVWEYLVDPEKRATWFAGGGTEQHVGGRIDLTFRNSGLSEDDDPPPAKYAGVAGEHSMSGRVLACDPPRLLAFTWGEGENPSEVRFELAPHGNDVHLVVTHSNLSGRDGMLSVSGGWHSHLDILVAQLEGRTPKGFWRKLRTLEAEYAERLPVE